MTPPYTGCPCGCNSRPGWDDPDCTRFIPAPRRDNVEPPPPAASSPDYAAGWSAGWLAAMTDLAERQAA